MDGLLIGRILPHEIGRHVEHDRSAFHTRPVKRPGKVLGRGVGPAQGFKSGATQFGKRRLVGILEVLGIGRRRVAGHQDEAHLGARCVGQSGCAIGDRRSVGHGCNADLAGHLRIAMRHQHRTAFMNGGNKLHTRLFLVAVHHEQIGVANQAKQIGDGIVRKAAGQRFVHFQLGQLHQQHLHLMIVVQG